MFRITLFTSSILTFLAFSQCANPVEESETEQIEISGEKNKPVDGFTTYNNFKIIKGISADSVLENNSKLIVEEIFAFEGEIDEPFPNDIFSPDQWQMMYKDPRVFMGQFPYLVFGSTQICISDDYVGICDSCIDTTKITQLQFDFFDSRPNFMPSEPEFETWKKITPISNSFGEINVASRTALCYDTGTHSFELTTESGTLHTVNERQNLIYFEADVDQDSKYESYLIVYGACGVWMNIYRITQSE